MKLKAKSFAKLNLSLGVTGKKENGYHTIESVMQSVSLYDTITINITDNNEVKVSTNCPSLNSENNIAYKAAKLYLETANISKGVEIFIEKQIPQAAGLGGGSANAATVLMLLNKVFNKFSFSNLSDLALKLGADVPFCLTGGTSRVEGVGEKVTKINSIPMCYFVLVKNSQKASTKQMYEQLDTVALSKTNNYKTVCSAIKNGNFNLLCSSLYNDFNKVGGNEQTKYLFEIFKKFKPNGVGLSGAGPTVFAVFGNYANAEQLYNSLNEKVEFACICTPTENSFEIID